MWHRLTFDMTRRQLVLFYGLLVATLGLYLCSIGLNQWANPYYSAAVQAGTQNWQAFFFGSFDAGNAITIDKTPLSLWLMGLSAHVFGLNYFSIVLPNVLAALASMTMLFFTLRARLGFVAAGIGAAVFALTPVVVAVFRFNDPDALLTCLMLAAVVVTFRLNRTGHARWSLLIGVLIGFGFMTKMLQAFLILPALALPYLLFGRPRLAKRCLHLALALLGLVLSAGWWVVLVDLTPAANRPYIGGTQTNSIIELVLGYNGLGRLTGGAGNTNGAVSGVTALQPSLVRLFGTDVGGYIAWLLPLALIVSVAGIVLTWRTRRTQTLTFELLVLGSALVISALTFSFMQGIFHQYYTVALAPYIAALAGYGIYLARRNWATSGVKWLSIATVAISGILGTNLMSRAVGQTLPAAVILIATILACVLLATLGRRHERVKLTLVLTAVALLFGQVVYGYHTLTTAQLASTPVAGPPVVFPFTVGGRTTAIVPVKVEDMAPVRTLPGDLKTVYTFVSRPGAGYRWAAGINNGLPAAEMQLASRQPILEIGGYAAKDPFPTLARFKQMVDTKQIRYYVLTGIVPIDRSTPLTTAQQIQIWVREHHAPTLIGTTRVYDLQQ